MVWTKTDLKRHAKFENRKVIQRKKIYTQSILYKLYDLVLFSLEKKAYFIRIDNIKMTS